MQDNTNEQIIYESDPLSLDISDYQLVKVIDKRIRDSKADREQKKIPERQDKNLEYLLGKQIDETKLADHHIRYMDNILYEAEASIKPIALSRLPDLIVRPGQDTEQSKKSAKDLSEFINSDLRRRENRKVLAIAFKHIPIYFTAVIKAIWNPEKGKHGGIEFVNVNPKNIVFDHTCKSNNPDDMDFIAEEIELSIKEVIMRFPDKERELLNILNMTGKPDDAMLATKMKYTEVWFTWYEKSGSEYKRIEGVAWKYKSLVLGKMKNPNWDWEGQDVTFTYKANTNSTVEPTEDDMRGMFMGENNDLELETQKVYRNHFENPRKPYIILGYDQYGLGAYDSTSRIEQNIWLQDNVNSQGKQITGLAKTSAGKNVWSKLGGLEKKDIEEMDMEDWNEDVLVDGEVNKVFTHIQGQQPTNALFQAQDINRDRIFSKMGVNATTRGSVETDTATTAQIARESDFGRIDDLTEDTINYGAQEMANWSMQFIKLRVNEEDIVRVVGKSGSTTFTSIKSDMVEDGMEVLVFASGVDKVMRKREAYEKAKLKLIDPLTFFEDIDAPDPQERTKRLMMFLSNPEMYTATYAMGLEGTEQQAQALNGNVQEAQIAPQSSLSTDIQSLLNGQMPAINTDDAYIAELSGFIKSPDFAQMDENQQATIADFAQQILEAKQGSQQPQMA